MERTRQLLRPSDIWSQLVKPTQISWIRGPVPELIYKSALIIIWLMTIAVLSIDVYNGALSQPSRTTMTMASYSEHPYLGSFVPAVALICLLVIVLDMASYTPRLYALVDFTTSSSNLFDELRKLSLELHNVIREIETHPPDSLSTLAQAEENVLVEANNYCLLDRLRLAIQIRLLIRVLSVLLALALIAYGLSYATNGRFMDGLEGDPSFLRHLYFTITTFFTIGFGDVRPAAGALAYGFVLLCVVLVLVTTSFVIVTGLASNGEFQMNIRKAARHFVTGLARI